MTAQNASVKQRIRQIKCIVWDADNTLWDGTLTEDTHVTLRAGVTDTIKELDQRGILHSIASKNDPEPVLEKLREFGIADYFLYPQIHWGTKSESIAAVAQSLNIGIDSLAFIDDQAFERDEVASVHNSVLCLEAETLPQLLKMQELKPEFITEDSPRRRLMYMSDQARNAAEARFNGPSDDFLASLGMTLTLSRAGESDLARASELTLRTNQLNTTGYTYDFDELRFFTQSADHMLLVAELEDRYGSYGKIGLVLIDTKDSLWTIRLLLMSCRVMSRGVGGVIINYLRNLARSKGVKLQAEFIANDRNRMMYATYKFNYFNEISQDGPRVLLENDLSVIQAFPAYMKLVAP